jgi:PAS domain S-box-containing protein
MIRNILGIDDNPDNLLVLSAILKRKFPGCRFYSAMSGQEGIELAQKTELDIIILDIIMPDMDGYETCSILKSDKQTNSIPVIMLTALDTGTESRSKGLDAGADAFLSKPVEDNELVAQVNAMLRIKDAEDKLRNERDMFCNQAFVANKNYQIASKRYQSLSDLSPVGVFHLDQKAHFTYANKRFSSITGIALDDISNYDLFMLLGSMGQGDIRQSWDMLLDGQIKDFSHDINIQVGDKEKWLSLRMVADECNKSDSSGYIGTIEDITPIVSKTIELKKHKKQLSLGNQIAQIFLTSDKGMLFKGILDVLLKTFGCKKGYIACLDHQKNLIVESSFGEFISDDAKANKLRNSTQWSGLWGKHLEQKNSGFYNESRLLENELMGGQRMVISTLTLDAELLGQIVLFDKGMDFTIDDMELLEYISSQMSPVLKVINDKHLSERQFTQAEREYDSLREQYERNDKIRVLGSLAAGIARDFARTFGDIIEITDEIAFLRKSKTSIEKQVDELLDLVQGAKKDFEALSSLDSQDGIEVDCLDFAPVVTNFCKSNSHLDNVTISHNFKLPLSRIRGSIVQLKQLLRQLLQNSLEGIERRGKIAFELSICEDPLESKMFESTLCLEVKDERNNEVERYPGFNIGLLLIDAIVNSHSGRHEFGMNNGVYRHKVFFPLCYDEPSTSEKALKPKNARILLVDDDVLVSMTVQTMLRTLGFKVTVVNSSEEALELFDEKVVFDIMITDQSMPRINGCELSKMILKRFPDFPIMMFTAYDNPRIRNEAKQVGIQAFAAKPMSNHELGELVDEVLKGNAPKII